MGFSHSTLIALQRPHLKMQFMFKNEITDEEICSLKIAVHNGSKGIGKTYPNPSVGCILIYSPADKKYETYDQVIGAGLHAKAGFPHAEPIALLEANKHIEGGINAARSILYFTSVPYPVIDGYSVLNEINILEKLLALISLYLSSNGMSALFSRINHCKVHHYNKYRNDFNNYYTSAFVTLEPCCHYGQTPPCVLSLVFSGIRRVVIASLDPNPHVDGRGIMLLRENSVLVHFILTRTKKIHLAKDYVAKQSKEIIYDFFRRLNL